MEEESPRYYPVETTLGRFKTWAVEDRTGGLVALKAGIVVPSMLTEAEAISYAERLNGS